ncbi:phytanoyl-CoA dioxygenase family protein [Bacillus sp. FSL K6-3431]|uniref:phytanoyl-CoA dioxygenase family protein n=1 Tax=Bacillus sp. FSL K6-3431 TaxID=2921500 RepID=UPI0030FB2A03
MRKIRLSYIQRKELFEKGYVHIPGVIPQAMLNEVRKAINHSLGEEGMDKEELATFRSQSYCPELQYTPVISDLYHRTPIHDLVDSVIDTTKIFPINGAQIALRFPRLDDPAPEARPHIDGMYSPNNGVTEGTIQNFTALVGVLLSDLTEDDAGNFTVWPGTHRTFESYFSENGPEVLLNGMPPVEMPEPIQIKGKAGDIVFCHYQLAHGIGPNISPDIRYAVFFRINHVEVKNDWKAPMSNIWMHYKENMQVFEIEDKVTTE